MRDRAEKGIISQTRALYNQLSGESRRLAQGDLEAARQSGPVAKALLVACILAVLAAAAILVYGIINFPDAPIRETAGGYAGKHGQPHTSAEYEQFTLWKKCVVVSFGLAFLSGFGAVVADRKGKRRRGVQ